ncbi:MAG: hypothetical protein SVE93_01405 [Candidatus Thermoplasmatota archaeon]|nr:hypothetical protein [Candidatus Thermoplasmatota archaeon]
MAEKKDDVLEVPEFDEKQFYNDTKKGTFVALMSFGFGLLMSAVSEVVHYFAGFPPAFIIGLFAIALLMTILKSRYNMKAMDWFSAGGVYMLTWICFWVLFTNPPFQ